MMRVGEPRGQWQEHSGLREHGGWRCAKAGPLNWGSGGTGEWKMGGGGAAQGWVGLLLHPDKADFIHGRDWQKRDMIYRIFEKFTLVAGEIQTKSRSRGTR